jgi:hypothetical protein
MDGPNQNMSVIEPIGDSAHQKEKAPYWQQFVEVKIGGKKKKRCVRDKLNLSIGISLHGSIDERRDE